MGAGKRIAPHETFMLHEILMQKSVCATKASAMSALVKDDALRQLLQQDLTVSQGQIRELMNLIQSSEYASGIGPVS